MKQDETKNSPGRGGSKGGEGWGFRIKIEGGGVEER